MPRKIANRRKPARSRKMDPATASPRTRPVEATPRTRPTGATPAAIIDTDSLLALVGCDHNAAEVQRTLEAAGLTRATHKLEDEHCFLDHGFSYSLTKLHQSHVRIRAVQFHDRRDYGHNAEGHVAKYARYAGELPFGLSFELDPRAVRKKLGKPTDTRDGGLDRWVLTAKKRVLTVFYDRGRPKSITWRLLG